MKKIIYLIIAILSISFVNADATAYLYPTSTGGTSNQWANPTNAYSSNNVYASEASNGQMQDYYDFSFGAAVEGATGILGIEVASEGYCGGSIVINGDRCQMKIDLSDDGGSSWSTKKTFNWYVDAGETIDVVGTPTDTWGMTLTGSDFTNANFRARIEMDRRFGGGTEQAYLDGIRVKVHYTPAASYDPCDCPASGNWTISNAICVKTSFTCNINQNIYLWNSHVVCGSSCVITVQDILNDGSTLISKDGGIIIND